jgi:hypothetical protein
MVDPGGGSHHGTMVVELKNRSDGVRRFEWSRRDLAAFLLDGNLSKSGEPTEEIRVFHGGVSFVEGEGERSGVPWTFSNGAVDRYLERIDPAGWELDSFRRNPVVQWAHRSDIPAIGKAAGVGVGQGALTGEVVFHPREIDPCGWSIGERVRFGSLTAGSVGFIVLQIEIPEPNPDTELIYRRQELVEFSICNVPANPFALVQDNEQSSDSGVEPQAASITIHDFWKGAFV